MRERKFGFGGNGLNTREIEENSAELRRDNKAQELVNFIETAEVNTAFNFKLIPRQKIVFSKDNFYPMTELEVLEESILNEGLLHNLEVSYDEDNDIYILSAGERRTRAIDSLIEKYDDFEDKDSSEYKKYLYNVAPFKKGYSCKVSAKYSNMKICENLTEDEADELDSIAKQLRLRVSNELGREYDAVRTKRALDEIMSLKNRRNEILGNSRKLTNKELGDELNISERMIQKYKAIDRLIPELRDLFMEHGITLTDGANYANLSAYEQGQILSLIKNGGNKKETAELYNQLNNVRLEVKEKDRELQRLESEKAEAIERIDKAKADAEALENKIRQELEQQLALQNEKDKKYICSLEQELQNAKETAEKYDKQRRELDERSAEVVKLKKELTKKSSVIHVQEDITGVKIAIRLESQMKGLQNSLKELKATMHDYEKVFAGSADAKLPEEYLREIKNLLIFN